MVNVALFGKSDIIEKLAWCKKYGASQDENERFKNARLELKPDNDAIMACFDPALDNLKIADKLKALELQFPNEEELDVFNMKIVAGFGLYCLFEQFEDIPGKPEYDIGFGSMLESHKIFLEDKIHDIVETQEVKKTGMFKKETVTTKEKKVKPASEVFGSEFNDEIYRLGITGREKDNRDNMRYGLRLAGNVITNGEVGYVPEKLDQKWKDEETFFKDLCSAIKLLETGINKTFTAVGYETPPDFTILLGQITTERKVESFSKETISDVTVIDCKYG